MTTDKLKQAIGRARITRWERTIILCITNEPVPGFTEYATPITYKQLMQAPCLEDIGTHKTAETVTPLPPATTAEKTLQLKEQHPSMTQTEIATQFGITQQAVSKALNCKVTNYNQTTFRQGVLVHGNCVEKLYNVTIQSQHASEGDNTESNMTDVTLKNGTDVTLKNGTDVTLQTEDVTLKNGTDVTLKNSTQRGQILDILQGLGEVRTAEIIEKIDGHPTAIKTELKRLLQTGEIVKVKHGIYALSENDKQHPEPRPPIPSSKPKPIDTEIETPPPVLDDKILSATDIKAEMENLFKKDTYSDLHKSILYWRCALFTDELRKEVKANHNDLSESEQEQLIEKSRKVTLLYIDSFKNMLTFEDRARLSISLTQYKQQHFEVSPAFYDPKITQDSLKRKPPPITGVLK